MQRAGEDAPLLLVRDLSVHRAGAAGRDPYLLEVSALRLPRGGRLGLVGRSGSGKTTMLEMLGLMSWPTRIGAFALAARSGGTGPPEDLVPPLRARDAGRLTALRASRVGFVPQDGGLLPYLDVLGNARLAARLAGDGGGGLDDSAIGEVATAMGMGDLLRRRPGSLSGGQRQRAAVLRALASGADLLIGDEPTGALDPETADDVMRAIEAQATRAGAAVVIASHDEGLLRAHGYEVLRVALTRGPGGWRATLHRPDFSGAVARQPVPA
jgi:putative ABC transport system ATP-binding protein